MPGTVVGVAFLLVVLTPGAILELLRQRRRPGRIDSTFVETVRVILSGVVLSGVSLLVVGAIATAAPSSIVNIRAMLLTSDYIPNNLWTTNLIRRTWAGASLILR